MLLFARMPNSADALRRWLGMFCLAMAAGMLIWGRTVLQPHLTGVGFVCYWLGCFTFTFAAIFVAMLDLRTLRRRAQEQHRELIRRTLDETTASARRESDPSEH